MTARRGSVVTTPGEPRARTRRIAGVSLKNYFGLDETCRYLEAIAAECTDLTTNDEHPLDLFVMPSFPLLERAVTILEGTGIAVGAQNLAAESSGAQTGEVSGQVLADLGCRFALVGHAERRARFHEHHDVVAGKLDQARHAGLVPVLCVGEPTRIPTAAAVDFCLRQLSAARSAFQDSPIVVAYEPVWAIGARRPAPAPHVRQVCGALKDPRVTHLAQARVVYGGAAGLHTFDALGPTVDGLFLGRFAHEPAALGKIASEIASRS